MAGIKTAEGQLAALDITQLRVFDTLFRERSVRQTAERLNLTSSAISHALGRLREVTGDELFIRQPDGMYPTVRALEIAPKLQAALEMLRDSFSRSTFDPAECTRTFVIASVPYVADILLPRIMADVLAEAPQARFRLQSVNNALVADLDSNRVDLAVAAFGRLPESLDRSHLQDEPFVVAVRRDHPLAKREVDLASAMIEYPHVEILLDGADAEYLDAYRVKAGVERKVVVGKEEFWKQFATVDDQPRHIAMVVGNSETALAMATKTDMIAVVVRAAALASANIDGLFVLSLPNPPPPLRLEMVWHKRKSVDPALTWLRSRLESLGRPD